MDEARRLQNVTCFADRIAKDTAVVMTKVIYGVKLSGHVHS